MLQIVCIVISCLLALAEGSDSLNQRSEVYLNGTMGVNETLVSDNGKYKVAFWNSDGSSDHYLTISLNNVNVKDTNSITWAVPNPCPKRTCKLILRRQRGLAIQGTDWTSGTKGKQYAHVARITDEGNLVVLATNRERLWESFEHPTNTLLAGQKFKLSHTLFGWASPDSITTVKYGFSLRMDEAFGIALSADPNNIEAGMEAFVNSLMHGIYFSITTSASEGCLYAQLDSSGRFNLVQDSRPHPRVVAYWNNRYHGNTSFVHKVFMEGIGIPGMYSWDGNSWLPSWDSTFTLSLHESVLDPPKGRIKQKPVELFAFPFAVGVFILGVVLWRILKNRRREAMSSPIPECNGPRRMRYNALKRATKNFTDRLGAGGSGSVYKGKLRDNTLVAVKVLERSRKGEREFEAEVKTMGCIHHVNLVRLIGFCSEGNHRRLLVYEYMENGSLDKHLFSTSSTSVLPWSTRFNIALGIAKGMSYCHDYCRSRIVHCDLKPQNVLLDAQLVPKVADFGLAKLMSREQSSTLTVLRGTRGYLAPEWISDLPITVKADVYSYGQMLLELVSGRKNFNPMEIPSKQYYPDWLFNEMVDGNFVGMSDPRLGREVDLGQVEVLVKVAFLCIQGNSLSRPSMEEVVGMIEGSMDVPMPSRL